MYKKITIGNKVEFLYILLKEIVFFLKMGKFFSKFLRVFKYMYKKFKYFDSKKSIYPKNDLIICHRIFCKIKNLKKSIFILFDFFA